MSAPLECSRFFARLESPRGRIFAGLLLVGLLVAVYAPSFRVPFLFDDFDSIIDNPTLHQFTTAWVPPGASGITVSGRPLLNVSLAINYALGGTAVSGYHAANLLLHTLAALTLWGLLRRTFRQPVLADRYGETSSVIAWFAAALWALHPLLTIAVTYVIQRAEVLAGLFYLLTLYGFIRSVQTPSRVWPCVTGFACLAGMASKEVMASAPFVVFLYDRTFVSGSFAESWRRHRKLHMSLAATWLLLAACILQSGGRGGSIGYAKIAWWEYALTQAAAIVRYLWLSIWPSHLIFDYGSVVMLKPTILIPCGAVVVALLAFTIYALRRYPVVGFPAACFFLILAPTSSVVPVVTQTIAEHRMYLPLVAIVVIIVLILLRTIHRWSLLLLTVAIFAAGARAYVRNQDYRTELALWQDTVDHFPLNARAFYNLGVIQFERGQVDESLVQFRAAVALAPRYALAQYNLGYVLLKLKRAREALSALETAVRIAPDKDTFRAGLGEALFTLGRAEEALPHFQAALTSNSEDQALLKNYTSALLSLGRYADAIPLFQKSIRLDPRSAQLHANLGIALVKSGSTDEGLIELEHALKIDSARDDIRDTLAALLALNGHNAEAITQYETMLSRHAPNADQLDLLGMLYGRTARYSEARAAFQRALALNPNHSEAREHLAKLEAFLERRVAP